MKKIFIFLTMIFILSPITCKADYDSYQAELAERKARVRQIAMYKAAWRRERVLYRKTYGRYPTPVYVINGGGGYRSSDSDRYYMKVDISRY